MRFAYADPPYIGKAHLYGEEEVDHAELLARLRESYDGWALSCWWSSLAILLPMLGKSKYRIAVWIKPDAQPRNRIAASWEPVIYRTVSNPVHEKGKTKLMRDYVIASRFRGFNGRTGDSYYRGHKPDDFCYWLFELLGMKPEDEFDDLFPGTGRVARAWELWKGAGMELFVQTDGPRASL